VCSDFCNPILNVCAGENFEGLYRTMLTTCLEAFANCKGLVYAAYGTGSIPPGLNGWHRNILFKARKDPLNRP